MTNSFPLTSCPDLTTLFLLPFSISQILVLGNKILAEENSAYKIINGRSDSPWPLLIISKETTCASKPTTKFTLKFSLFASASKPMKTLSEMSSHLSIPYLNNFFSIITH